VPLDHHEFDLAAFKCFRRQSGASHFFDGQPICQEVLPRLNLRWEFRLQKAALPHVPVRDLKRHRLGSFAEFLFGGLGKFPHALFLYRLSLVASEVGGISGEIVQGRVGWLSLADQI
jgi:hypothetical protein